LQSVWLLPSVFGCSLHLQCQPVRGSGHPRGMALATRMQELQAEEQRRGTNGILESANSVQTRAPYLQTFTIRGDANPNTAESMVKVSTVPSTFTIRGDANPNAAESMVKARAPCLRHSPSEVMLTLTRQNPRPRPEHRAWWCWCRGSESWRVGC
jgi:hypothetical protein